MYGFSLASLHRLLFYYCLRDCCSPPLEGVPQGSRIDRKQSNISSPAVAKRFFRCLLCNEWLASTRRYHLQKLSSVGNVPMFVAYLSNNILALLPHSIVPTNADKSSIFCVSIQDPRSQLSDAIFAMIWIRYRY